MPRQKKLLLRKYKYPPEEAEDALQTVIRQCELLSNPFLVFYPPFLLNGCWDSRAVR